MEHQGLVCPLHKSERERCAEICSVSGMHVWGIFFLVTDKWLTILLTVWGSNRTHVKLLPCSTLYLVKNVDTLIQENT